MLRYFGALHLGQLVQMALETFHPSGIFRRSGAAVKNKILAEGAPTILPMLMSVNASARQWGYPFHRPAHRATAVSATSQWRNGLLTNSGQSRRKKSLPALMLTLNGLGRKIATNRRVFVRLLHLFQPSI
jgi:hypothetical protein